MAKMDIFSLSNWFLNKESMTHKKMQKLCYYAQAWHLALYNDKLIDEEFIAWIHGPVCVNLYNKYKEYGWNPIEKIDFKIELDEEVKDFLEATWETYGEYSGHDLESITRCERPWLETRKGLKEFDQCHDPISCELMREYYQKVYEDYQNV